MKQFRLNFVRMGAQFRLKFAQTSGFFSRTFLGSETFHRQLRSRWRMSRGGPDEMITCITNAESLKLHRYLNVCWCAIWDSKLLFREFCGGKLRRWRKRASSTLQKFRSSSAKGVFLLWRYFMPSEALVGRVQKKKRKLCIESQVSATALFWIRESQMRRVTLFRQV